MRLAAKKYENFSVIGLSPPHTLNWMEERGAETNGRSDPIGSPKISLKFFLNNLE